MDKLSTEENIEALQHEVRIDCVSSLSSCYHRLSLIISSPSYSPNIDPLAEIGINVEENEHLFRDPPRGAFRVRTEMDTRLVTLRLVPGFDDTMIIHMIKAARDTHLRGLILQLYGTGNLPTLKNDLITCLTDASEAGVCVIVSTQCHTGSVILGHYATKTIEPLTFGVCYLHSSKI